MKKLFSLLLAAALLLSLFSFAAAEEEKSVNVGISNALTTLNPLAMDNAESTKYAVSLVFLPLMELDGDMQFVPQLAESITTEDHLSFIIRLQDSAVWSDGTPVTAQDVEFTMLLAADPDSANAALAMYMIEGTDDETGLAEAGVESLSGVKVLDDKTLVVTAKWPTALDTFRNNFGRYVMPVPKHVLKDVPRADLMQYAWFNKPDVISGPYFVQEADFQNYVHFVANENYFLGAPKIKYLNFNVVASAKMLAGLQSGEIDLIHPTMGNIPVEDYDAIRALPGVTAVLSDAITNESIFINTAKVPDARIRRALLLGMDRQTVFDGLLFGNGEVVDGFLVSASPYYSEALGVTAYDPAAAKALVDEAKADGAKTDYTWYVNSSESAWISAVEYFKAGYEEIGLNIDIRTVVFDSLMEVAGNLEHDIMSVEYSYAPVDPYTDVVWLLGGEGSWTGFASDATDEALALSQTLDDAADIAQQYLIVDQAMQQEAPMISGWVIAKLGAVSDRLVNAVPDIFGTFVNVQDWDIQ